MPNAASPVEYSSGENEMSLKADEQARLREAENVTVAGGITNVVLAALKIGAGAVTGYLPLTASGFHSASDILADAVTWFTLRLGAKGADQRFHYGRRRIETLMALFAAFFLVYVSIELVTDAIGGEEHGHGISAAAVHGAEGQGAAATEGGEPSEVHGAQAQSGRAWGLFLIVGSVALVSVAAKETLFRITRRRGIRLNSPMLIAKAWHHRTDSLGATAVLFSLVLSLILPGTELVEVVTTIVIAGMILHSAWEVGSDAVKELIDLAPSRRTMAAIEETAENVEGVTFVQSARIRTMGGALYVELTVEVDPSLTVEEAYSIAQAIRKGVMSEVSDVIDVSTMVAPRGEYLRRFLAAET